MVKAIRYKVHVYDSFLHYIHGMKKEIEEIFIPSKKITINIANGSLNAFRCKEPRGSKDLTEIEIDNDFVEKLEKFVELKEELMEYVKKYLK